MRTTPIIPDIASHDFRANDNPRCRKEKPVPTPLSKRGAGFFRIMRQATAA